MFRDQIKEADRAIQDAQRTKQEAEQKKRDNETVRVRCFFHYLDFMLIPLLHVRTDCPGRFHFRIR